MKYQIRVRWLAERDLEEAEDWYDEQRPGLGAEFRQTIADLFARLAANPQIYPPVHGEVRRAVLRRFPYLVYFLIEDTKVIIWRCSTAGGILKLIAGEGAHNRSLHLTRARVAATQSC